MNTEARETIAQFLRACNVDGYYSFAVNGREIPLEGEATVEKILEAIEQAPLDVQEHRLQQAQRELPGLLRRNASRMKAVAA